MTSQEFRLLSAFAIFEIRCKNEPIEPATCNHAKALDALQVELAQKIRAINIRDCGPAKVLALVKQRGPILDYPSWSCAMDVEEDTRLGDIQKMVRDQSGEPQVG